MQPDLPDVIVIGDSHSNALVAGCIAQGLKVEMLRFSGNIWHAGAVVTDEEHGIWVHKNKAMQAQIVELRARLAGRSVLTPEVPVLLSAGFHLGRFVSPFGALGHVTEARAFAGEAQSQYVSQRFASAYLGAHRGVHLRVIRRMTRQTQITVVAPPICQDVPNVHRFLALQKARMEAVGLRVYDPNADFQTAEHCLPAAFVAEDMRHGNADYGAAVIGKMIADGLITAPVRVEKTVAKAPKKSAPKSGDQRKSA